MARFEDPLHSLGERLQVPAFATRQALAWWVAADLLRRHPTELRVIEAYPHQYGMAVTLVRRLPEAAHFSLAAFLTLAPSAHLVTPKGGGFNWLDALLTQDRRAYVVERSTASTASFGTPRFTASHSWPGSIAWAARSTRWSR